MIAIEIDIEELEKEYQEERERIEQKIERAFSVAGEEYVKTARQNGSYQDRTGQLRSAPGYQVYRKQFLAVNAAPHNETAGLIAEEPIGADMTLVVANGKDYASYVEAKGFDVSSSAELAAENKVSELLEAGEE